MTACSHSPNGHSDSNSKVNTDIPPDNVDKKVAEKAPQKEGHNPDNFNLVPPSELPFKNQQLTARARIVAELDKRILMLDGAMGIQIQTYKLQEADYRGERFADIEQDVQGNNDLLVLIQPNIIKNLFTIFSIIKQ